MKVEGAHQARSSRKKRVLDNSHSRGFTIKAPANLQLSQLVKMVIVQEGCP